MFMKVAKLKTKKNYFDCFQLECNRHQNPLINAVEKFRLSHFAISRKAEKGGERA